MPHKKDVSIMDVTIRDGSYAINYQWSLGQVAQIAGALDKAGIHYIEVSHGCGLGAAETMGLAAAASDVEYVRSAKSAVKKAKIGVIAGASHVTRLKDIDSVIDDTDFIRFATNVNEPQVVEENLNYAKKLRPKLPIFFQLMRSSRLPKQEILKAAHTAQEMGADVVYVVDTAGHFIPQEVEDVIAALVAKLKIKIGFHGHDNLRMAVANSLAAIKAGAAHVDASLKGIGRAGGNAQIEALVSLMKRAGLAQKIDLDMLATAAEEFVAPIMPPATGISQIDILTADANIDLYPAGFYEAIAEAANIDLNRLIRAFSDDAKTVEVGHESIERGLKKLGINPKQVFDALDEGKKGKKGGPKIERNANVILALNTPITSKYFSPELLDGLEERFPEMKFSFVDFDRKGIKNIDSADVLFEHDTTPDVLAGPKRLKWLHTVASPGAEALKQLKSKGIMATCVEGVYSEAAAETALGALLAMARKIKHSVDIQHEKKWGYKEVIGTTPYASELYGATLVIIGYSAVGQRLARLCAGFGMNVIVASAEEVGDSKFVDEFIDVKGLGRYLPAADFIVFADEVRGAKLPLLGAAEFQKMKKDVIVVNIAASGMIDEAALAKGLQHGTVGGAALDVFKDKPLPDGHPLFSVPNLIVLPGISRFSAGFWGRAVEQFAGILKELSS